MIIGNVEMISVSDGEAYLDPIKTFAGSTVEQWRNDYPELINESGQICGRLGSVIIRSKDKMILVDTGLQAQDGQLFNGMMRNGINREAIQLVVTTHLHPDHVGWNLTDGRPTFPFARYLVPRKDWEYWTQPSVLSKATHIRDQVIPLKEQRIMDLIDNEYKITDELTAMPIPGHTPGHISILVASEGHKAFILGDVAHTPEQAHHTDWSPTFDLDKSLSRSRRRRVLQQLEADGILVSAGHFPSPGFGHFVLSNSRRVWRGV